MTIVKHAPYSHGRYMKLRNPKSVLVELKKLFVPAMNILRNISLKYDMGSKVGITILHRHHALRNDQILVESLSEGVSTTAPTSCWNENSEFLIPHTWELSFDFNTNEVLLIPLEFLDVRSEGVNASELREVVAQLETNNEFTTELCAALIETGTSHLIGLQLIHRESIIDRRGKQYLSEISTHSFNDCDEDISRVMAVDELPPNSMPVFWFMKENSTYCEGCIPERPGEGLAVHTIPHEGEDGPDGCATEDGCEWFIEEKSTYCKSCTPERPDEVIVV